MNFALLVPAALAALAALLLPLLIHLARRSERRPTDFAALRWLQAQARPRRNVRFDEWLLLALRLLLVALLTLLLARPVLFGAPDATPWVVAAPGVAITTLRSTPAPDGAQRRWLAPGFPKATDAMPADRVPVGSLLRELDALLPADVPLTVLVPDIIDGADAERPVLSRRVDWRVVPAAVSLDAPEAAAKAQETRNSELSFPRKREPSDFASTAQKSLGSRFRGNDGLKERVSGDAGTHGAFRASAASPMPTLVVRHAPDRAPALRYLRAATEAWRVDASADTGIAASTTATTIASADAAQPVPADAKLLVWLAPGPLPDPVRDWIAHGGRALLDAETTLTGLDDGTARWRNADGDVLVRGIALGRGQALQWTRAMTPAAMPVLLEADFPQRLRALMMPPPPAPARVSADAYAPLVGEKSWPQIPRELAPWLVLLIAALFLVERWFASSPRRRSSA